MYIVYKIKIVTQKNMFCIPECFNTNISHQLFKYTITFVDSQRWNTNLKVNFVLKNLL
jgi:hypothetical protein